MWAIWTHKNNVILNSANYYSASIIKLARKIFHETSLYGRSMASNTSRASKRVTVHR